MKVINFVYNKNVIEFSSDENIMVNATQMAKAFGKRLDHFLRSDHAKTFIKTLELTPFGGRSAPLKKGEIIKTKNGAHTFFNRVLALKFAAWLDPKFELWVYTTIDQLLLGHYKEVKQATINKLKAQKELEAMKDQLMESNSEVKEYFELEKKVKDFQGKKNKAMKNTVRELELDLFSDSIVL